MKTHQTKLGPKLNATATTVLFGASLHLSASLILAIVNRDITYISPIHVLGLGSLAPQLLDSLSVTIIGWGALVLLGFFFLWLQPRFMVRLTISHKPTASKTVVKRQRTVPNSVGRLVPSSETE